MSLKDKAMLIQVSVSGWTARKLDRKVSDEIDVVHGAKDAGRYNKLLVDKQFLDPLTQHAGAIRAMHHKMTLPWMDGGIRLLPAKLFMEYSKEMRTLRAEYDRRIDDFITLYDSKLVTDARQRLGTMYDAADYPPGHKLREKFGIEIDEFPVPDAADFRVEVGDAERARIQEDITRRVNQRQEAAVRDAWSRVREVVGRYTKIGGDKAKIFDSMVTNAEELTRLLPGLNVNDDPDLERVCTKIVEGLLVHPERLRRSQAVRSRICSQAEAILAMCPRSEE
jgi:hypothetical protein